MKDIKEKVRDQSPKIRNPASRLPKELVRSAMLETKVSVIVSKSGKKNSCEDQKAGKSPECRDDPGKSFFIFFTVSFHAYPLIQPFDILHDPFLIPACRCLKFFLHGSDAGCGFPAFFS